MPTPDFILAIRERIGTAPLWLTGVTAVVTRGNGDLLLVRRVDDGEWGPVTGIIDPGEEPAVAAEREVLEEADIIATAIRLAWVHVIPEITYPNGDRSQYLDITFHLSYVSGEPHPADAENTDARWFNPDDLPKMSVETLTRIRYALDGEQHTRFKR